MLRLEVSYFTSDKVVFVTILFSVCFLSRVDLTTVEWVGFKLTFLEMDICHDHEIDILRSLAKLQLRYV